MGEREKIVLFHKKEQCCGCGACMNICPKQAISMEEDEYGFIYPHIDYEKCVSCGACKRVCAYQNADEKNEPIFSYAAVNENSSQKIMSASGGLFAALATKVINDGGVVFGCTLEFIDSKAVIHHVAIEKIDDLPRLQGSKYVQSSTEFSFKETLKYLSENRTVLYSGTPCQIAGLKGFLGKDYSNLILVDLICHGVPNARFFNDYLEVVRKKRKYREIVNYSFRDKKKGWGMNCRIDAIDENGEKKSLYIPARLASYNTFFLDGDIYRKNCYSCKYACDHRAGDITIGDYWGISNEHPEIVDKKGFEEKEGISCMIISTEKGKDFIDSAGLKIDKIGTEYHKIAKYNKQLNQPYSLSPKRDSILSMYEKKNYDEVEMYFKKAYRKQRIIHYIFNKLPRSFRKIIKKMKMAN